MTETDLDLLREAEAKEVALNDQRKFLCFRIASELHGFELLNVLEIVKEFTITRVPNVEEWLCGVTNLRGRVTPVIDLRKRLGAPESHYRSQWILVLEAEVADRVVAVGALVSSLPEVVALNPDDIQPRSELQGKVEHVVGIGHTDNDVVQIIDPTKLVAECLTEVDA